MEDKSNLIWDIKCSCGNEDDANLILECKHCQTKNCWACYGTRENDFHIYCRGCGGEL